MIDRNDILDAITKCVGYDPVRAPKASDIILNAWLEHFEDYPTITNADVMLAVKEYYKTPDRPWPQPASISTIARKLSRERYEGSDLDSQERQAHEALCNSKAAEDHRTEIARYADGRFGRLPAIPRDPGMDVARAELDAIRSNLTAPPVFTDDE